jgi:hypothetical protein
VIYLKKPHSLINKKTIKNDFKPTFTKKNRIKKTSAEIALERLAKERKFKQMLNKLTPEQQRYLIFKKVKFKKYLFFESEGLKSRGRYLAIK